MQVLQLRVDLPFTDHGQSQRVIASVGEGGGAHHRLIGRPSSTRIELCCVWDGFCFFGRDTAKNSDAKNGSDVIIYTKRRVQLKTQSSRLLRSTSS